MGANQSTIDNISKKKKDKINNLRLIGAIIYNNDINILRNAYNYDNKLEIYTEKALLNNFTKKEIVYLHNGIKKKIYILKLEKKMK